MSIKRPTQATTPSGHGCGPNAPTRTAPPKPLKQQVFEHIRAVEKVSRRDIAVALGVSPGSVTQLTADLIDADLICEIDGNGTAQQTRGRPPVALKVGPKAGFVVGMKLSDVKYSAVVVDFGGTVIAQHAMEPADMRQDTGDVVNDAKGLFDAVVAAAGLTARDIAALGLGLAGIVDHTAGVVPWSPLLMDRNVALRDLMAQAVDVPVHIDNDANMLTLAELWFGAGRSKASFAVITIEHGVGMGLVIENSLYRGALGLGMELGHTKVQLDGALCRCGKRGCLEAYLADYALVREARVALDAKMRAGGDDVAKTLELLYDQAKGGDPQAQAIFARAGRYLAAALSNIVHLFDPEAIILSGERLRYDYLYADEVLAEMQALTLDNGRGSPVVDINVWGDIVWARGAAALALSAVTDNLFGDRAEA